MIRFFFTSVSCSKLHHWSMACVPSTLPRGWIASAIPGASPGGVLEVFNALGESIAIVTVVENANEAVRADEVLTVRPLAIAG